MRKISTLAILCALAGCDAVCDACYDVVAVKSRPQDGYDTLSKTYGCTASVIRNVPATRYFVNGSQEEYVIRGVIGYKDICK